MSAAPATTAQKAFDPDDIEDEVVPHEDDELREKMRTIMPWVISFLAHLGIIILAGLAVFAVKTIVEKRDVPIPLADVSDEDIEGPLDRLPGPVTGEIGPMSDGAPPAPSDVPPPPMPSAPPSPAPSSRPVASSAASAFVAAPISSGLTTGSGAASSGNGIFKGVGGFIGGGGEGGGSRAARRIVFLVDASGSLVDTLPFVIDDLGRMLDARLGNDKHFNVIFFSGKAMNKRVNATNGLAALFPSQLELATPANRKKAIEWIQKIEAGGSSDPLSAIKLALEMDPDQIHLLSDNITGSGIWEMHQDRFMAEMMKAYDKALAKRKGPDGKTYRISFKTYQFVYKDPLSLIGKKPTLLRIVEDTGGKPDDYTFVTARQLGLR